MLLARTKEKGEPRTINGCAPAVLSTHETLESRLRWLEPVGRPKEGIHFAASYFPAGWGRLMPTGLTIMHKHQHGWAFGKRAWKTNWCWCCRPGGGGRKEAYVRAPGFVLPICFRGVDHWPRISRLKTRLAFWLRWVYESRGLA